MMVQFLQFHADFYLYLGQFLSSHFISIAKFISKMSSNIGVFSTFKERRESLMKVHEGVKVEGNLYTERSLGKVRVVQFVH